MPSTQSYHQAWSTDDELSYIERIGEFSIHTRGINRAELLKNYWSGTLMAIGMQEKRHWPAIMRNGNEP